MRTNLRQLVALLLMVLFIQSVRGRRRARHVPGLGRVGRNDGYTYRYATMKPKHLHR